jgi:diguanylate cyclase (GGDEF)-like protein
MQIDFQTTILAYVLVNYVCAIITCSTWLHNKNQFKGLELIFFDFLLQSIGLTLACFQHYIPDFASVLLANAFMYGGAILFPFAIANFANISVKKHAYIAALPVFISLYAYFTFIDINARTRLLIFTLMVLPIFIHTAYLIFARADERNRSYTLRIGIVNVILAAVHAIRALWAYIGPTVTDHYQFEQSEAILVTFSQLLMIYLLFAVTQMIQMKLLDQLDISMRRTEHLLDKTQKLATIDDLTQVYNRRKVETDLAMEIINFNLYQQPLSVLMIDIDHFKRFNDSYGHDIGDRVLMDVAGALKANIRNTDIVGRWGGEEFLIILPFADIKAAEIVGKKLVEAVRAINTHYCPSAERVSVSIGCTEINALDTLDQLIKRADIAMYDAKKSGRDQIVIAE